MVVKRGKAVKRKATVDKGRGAGKGKAMAGKGGEADKGKATTGKGVQAGEGKGTVEKGGEADKGKSKAGKGAEEDDEDSMREDDDSESDMEDDDDDSMDGDHNDTRLHDARTATDVEELVREGVDVNSEDRDGMTPLHVASSVEVARALLDNGAEINYWASEPFDPEKDDNASGSPLMTQRYDEDIALLLIERGADVCTEKDSMGDTALAIHVKAYNISVVQEMIRRNARVVVDADDIICATEKDDDDLLRLLLSVKGAGKSKDGRTALHGARKRVKLLIESGADVNARDGDGDSPLHTNISDEISLLVKAGAKLEAVNNKGETPLHIACRYAHFTTAWNNKMRFLMGEGASERVRRLDGKTPLDLLARAQTPLPGQLSALLQGFSVDQDS